MALYAKFFFNFVAKYDQSLSFCNVVTVGIRIGYLRPFFPRMLSIRYTVRT